MYQNNKCHGGLSAVETGRRVVYPWMCDQMGHLATQYYMTFYDDAFHHLLAMLEPSEHHSGRTLGWADVRHEIDYLHELACGDLILLNSRILAIGTKSITHTTEMFRVRDMAICSRVQSKTVRFDLNTRKSIVIEDGLKDNVEALGLMI